MGFWLLVHTSPEPESRRGLGFMLRAAISLWGRGERQRALAVLRVALHDARSHFGDRDEQTARVAGWLVSYLCAQADAAEEEGRLDEARQLAEEAVRAETRPDAVTAEFCLAQVLKSQGEFDESARLQRQVLTRSVERHGQRGPMVVQSLLQLANVLYLRQEAGDLDEARLLAIQARSIAVSEAGADAPTVEAADELLAAIQSES